MRDSSMRSTTACAVCGSTDAVRLPDPAAQQAMASDWRVVHAPLAKWSCARCGLVYRDPTLPHPAAFDTGYELYAHPPGSVSEQKRQSAYADWIASVINGPVHVLDVGCGNG